MFFVPMATTDVSLDRGMPASLEAERSILGAILLDNFAYTQAASALKADDFSLESHRRIYQRMMDLQESGRAIDLITLSEELSRHKEVESVGGIAYLSSLTDGLPHRANIEHYVNIVRDKAMLRGVINAAHGAIAQAMEQQDTGVDVLGALEGELFRLSESRAGRDFVGIRQIVKESFGSIDALYARGQRVTGLETHFADLDERTSGLQKSDLIILAARPSMGKTSLAMNIAENAAVKDKKIVAMFSLEMSRESLLLRLLCSQARVDAHKLRTGFLSRDDYNKLVEGLGRLADAPIFIDDTPGINVSEMRAKCRRLQHQQQGLDLVIVDYLQLMSGTPMAGGRKYENRTQEVSAISRGLKMLAKELQVPVVALSQLSRAPETRGTGDHRPQLSDLRESGSIEQDADLVMFIFREEVYIKDDPSLEGLAELIIDKQRNGPIGTVKLAFIKSSTRFENYAAEPGPEEGY
jgi:replicative DNA helicase